MSTSVQKVLSKEQLLKKFWLKGKSYHSHSEAFISKYKNKIIVIKYGGYALTKSQLVKSFARNIVLLNNVGIKVVVVRERAVTSYIDQIRRFRTQTLSGLISCVQMLASAAESRDLELIYQLLRQT